MSSLITDIFLLPRVYHIGTLNPAHRGRMYTESQEGNALSVSMCPEAWRQIARLGGIPLQRLYRLDKRPAVFVDGGSLRNDCDLEEEWRSWAITKGFLCEKELWRAWITDADGDECFFEFLTRTEAEEEIIDQEGRVDSVTVLAGTEKLARLMHMPSLTRTDASDYAIQIWAEHQLPHLIDLEVDGIWWCDRYDPDAYLAPKGAIFPTRLKGFTAKEADWRTVSDEQLLAEMPDARSYSFRYSLGELLDVAGLTLERLTEAHVCSDQAWKALQEGGSTGGHMRKGSSAFLASRSTWQRGWMETP